MSTEERGLVQRLMADADPSAELIASVIAAVQARGGIAAARARARELARQAEAELDGLPASPYRDALRDCLVYAVERRS
jgi:geranylgeranyl pyrophosphate synthase